MTAPSTTQLYLRPIDLKRTDVGMIQDNNIGKNMY